MPKNPLLFLVAVTAQTPSPQHRKQRVVEFGERRLGAYSRVVEAPPPDDLIHMSDKGFGCSSPMTSLRFAQPLLVPGDAITTRGDDRFKTEPFSASTVPA